MIRIETKGRYLFEEDEACLINERNGLDHDDKHHDERRDRVRKQPRVPPLSAVLDDAGVCHHKRGSECVAHHVQVHAPLVQVHPGLVPVSVTVVVTGRPHLQIVAVRMAVRMAVRATL